MEVSQFGEGWRTSMAQDLPPGMFTYAVRSCVPLRLGMESSQGLSNAVRVSEAEKRCGRIFSQSSKVPAWQIALCATAASSKLAQSKVWVFV